MPQSGGPSAGITPTTIDHLPRELLCDVFSRLDVEDRYSAVPLVCHRWRNLVASPALLRHTAVDIAGTRALSRLHSFAEWLEKRGAGRVRSLQLQMEPACVGSEESTATTAVAAGKEASTALAAFTASLAACGAARAPRTCLSELRLGLDYLPLCLANDWAPAAFRTMRALQVHVFESQLSVAAPLQALTALRELSLQGAPLALAADTWLPAGLTKLHLGGCEDAGLIGKVACATALRSLSLSRLEHSAEQYDMLGALPCLERLAMSWCDHLPSPAILARMGRLQALHIDHTPRRGLAPQVCAELHAALEPLAGRLRHLYCAHIRAASSMPAALAHLAGLESFCWAGPAPCQQPALAKGPWLASLQHLAVPADVAAASLPALAAATRLQGLGLSRFAPGGSPAQFAILRSLARHPSITRVCLHLREAQLPVGLFDAAMEAQRSRASLCIERSDAIAEALRAQDVAKAHSPCLLARAT